MTVPDELGDWLSAQFATIGRRVARSPAAGSASAPWSGSFSVAGLQDVTPPGMLSDGSLYRVSAWHESSDGRLFLAFGGNAGQIEIWEFGPATSGGRLVERVSGPGRADVRCLAWQERAPGELLLAVATQSSEAEIFTIDVSGRPVLGRRVAGSSGTDSLAWHRFADGSLLLAAATQNGAVNLFEVDGTGVKRATSAIHGNEQYTDSITGPAGSVAWHTAPDGRLFLAAAFLDARVQVFDVDRLTHESILRLTLPTRGRTRSVTWQAVLGGSSLLLTAGDDTTSVWDVDPSLASVVLLYDLPNQQGDNSSAAWWSEPYGRVLLATFGESGLLHFWNVDVCAPAPPLLHTHSSVIVIGGLSGLATRTGRILLAVGSDTGARVLEVFLDPPVPPSVSGPPSGGVIDYRGTWAGPYTMTDIDDVTPPEFVSADKPFLSSVWHQLADGRTLLATGEVGNALRIWVIDPNLRAMKPLARGGHGGLITDISLHELLEDRIILATSSLDGTVRVWILAIARGSIRQLTTIPGSSAPTAGVSWRSGDNGRLLLAVGGRDGDLSVHDVDVRDGVTTLLASNHLDGQIDSVEWVSLSDGRSLLASAGPGSGLRIWEMDGSRRLQLRSDAGAADRATWHRTWDGRLLLATYTDEQVTVCAVDPGTGVARPSARAQVPGRASIQALDWQALPDGRTILVGAAATGALNVFAVEPTGVALNLLGSFQCAGAPASVSSFLTRDARLLLAAGTRRSSQILSVVLDPAVPPANVSLVNDAVDAVALPGVGARQCSLAAVVALGAAGLWLGLGVVDDVVSLTGAETFGSMDELHDGRFGAVANSAGVALLRSLDWPAPARTGFAGLVARHLADVEAWTPPAGAPAARLLSALSRTPTAQSVSFSGAVDVSGVLAAFESLDRKVVTLLGLLGPHAVAADPALPLRLVDRVADLPVLPTKLLMTLDAGTRRAEREITESAGVERSASSLPVDVRHGRVDRLVPTHLALALSLDPDQQSVLEAGQQLLYRRYTVPSARPSRPVVVVLDTTAPTFGPIEAVLRTVAHMLTLMLWQRNAAPTLITLTHPAHAQEITSPEQLAGLWTSRTLSVPDPGPALATAAETGLPVIMLTTHYLAKAHQLAAASGLRLVTTHNPGRRPRSLPSGNSYHFHLPPEPMSHQVTGVVTELLTP